MKRLDVKPYVVLLVLAALLSACARSNENANAPQPANGNSSQQPPIAQSGTPLAVQPMPPPAPITADVAKPAVNPTAERNANVANAANARAPKLVAPDKKLDFGKQPQDKTLVRAIAIRNAGREDLKIESVAPS